MRRVMPDGSLRPYDPAFDGMPGVVRGGPTRLGAYARAAHTTMIRRRHLSARRPSPQTHNPNRSPEASPDTREWVEPQ
jgi:hypothetical protein